jgi:hypothetical protein
MKCSLAILSLTAIALPAWLFCGQNTVSENRADTVRPIQGSRDVQSISFGRQKKCAENAFEEFRSAGWEAYPHADFLYHYNETFKRCFVEFDLIISDTNGRTDIIRSVSDTEGREYASYASPSNDDLESSPTVCEVTLQSGEQMECSSLKQFEEFIRGYMGSAAVPGKVLTMSILGVAGRKR